jgi:hypothetical protein
VIPRLLAVTALVLVAGCRKTPPPAPSDVPSSSPITPSLEAAPPPPVTPPPPASADTDAGEPAAEGKRFLVIGDSHLFGKLGPSLREALSDGGKNQVWVRASCGSSPATWNRGVVTACGTLADTPGKPLERMLGSSKTPAVAGLLAEVKPHLTLVVMGSNFIRVLNQLTGPVDELLGHIEAAGSRCAWLGPPLIPQPADPMHDYNIKKFYAELRRALGDRCTLLDSTTTGFRLRSTGDDLHIEPGSATQWGRWAAVRLLAPPP